MVNNESAEILRLFNSGFQGCATHPENDLHPESKSEQIDYFVSHRHINPFGIFPDGPVLDFESPTVGVGEEPSPNRMTIA